MSVDKAREVFSFYIFLLGGYNSVDCFLKKLLNKSSLKIIGFLDVNNSSSHSKRTKEKNNLLIFSEWNIGNGIVNT